MCASGLRSATLAETLIRAGDYDVILAGGMESMSNAPYLLPKARWGARMGDMPALDAMMHDGLLDAFEHVNMIRFGTEGARKFDISREEQDEWALRSHQRAAAATDEGRLSEEIVGVKVPGKRDRRLRRGRRADPARHHPGEAGVSCAHRRRRHRDRGQRPWRHRRRRRPRARGRGLRRKRGLEPLGSIVAHAKVAEEPPNLLTVPGNAGKLALEKAGWSADDLDLVEINEAFAGVAIHSTRILGVDPDIVNVNGGALALGHPVGASGARILTTLLYELRRREAAKASRPSAPAAARATPCWRYERQ